MENENTKILKELEANSDMSLIQGEKMVNAVDGLEPALEGILMKADELVRETKNSKSQVVIRVEGDVESIKGEKGDTPEVDYDGINLKIAEMHKESMEVMQKELTDTVREDILTVAEAMKPELLHEVEEKIGEFGQVLLVDIKNVGDKVIQAESQIDVTDSNLKKLEKRVDGIKIPTYDLAPFAKADDVTKEVNDVKKTIDDKATETAKSIETLKGEVEKKVSDLEDEQMQRLQKVASKTVSLVELDDVNLDGLTQTDGKYDLGSGGGGGTPGGSDTQIQFNDNGAFGGNSGLTFDKTTETLTLTSGTGGTSILTEDTTGANLVGPILIKAGSTDTNGNQGIVTLRGGFSTGTADAGGVNIFGGNCVGAGASAGGVSISGGYASTGAGGFGGSVLVSGGTAEDGDGGAVTITGSSGTGTNRNGGNLNLGTGAPTGTGIAGKMTVTTTVTAAGTTGNRTIHKPTGTVNIAAAGTSVVVTNSSCSTNSIIFAVLRTNDATATIKNVVPAAGSFTIRLGAAATAEVSIGFWIIN